MLARLFGGADPWSLAPLRIAVGVVFLVHGAQKLFIFGFGGVAGYLSQQGIAPAGFWAVVITLLEVFGGIAILIGFLIRWAAGLLAIEMLVAIVTVHLPKGFFVASGGYEFPLTLVGGCLTLLFAGAKKPSVDTCLPREI